MKHLLVGEANPYGADPRFALYPRPRRAAGHRLATVILGLSESEYLERFDRKNLCPVNWSMREARATAHVITTERRRDQWVVLCGSRVARAFCRLPATGDEPWRVYPAEGRDDGGFFVIPHPSGRCRVWNHSPNVITDVRGALRLRGILPPVGVSQ